MTVLNPSSIKGRVVGLYLNADADDERIETRATERVEVRFEGFVGERHSGLTSASDVRYKHQYHEGTVIRNTRQVTILSAEELSEIAAAIDIPRINAEWLGANLLTSAIPSLTLLPPSTRLIFSSGAALVVDNENLACKFPAEVIDAHHPGTKTRFVPAARNKRGLVAWVEKEGEIAISDEIAVHLPPLRLYPHQ